MLEMDYRNLFYKCKEVFCFSNILASIITIIPINENCFVLIIRCLIFLFCFVEWYLFTIDFFSLQREEKKQLSELLSKPTTIFTPYLVFCVCGAIKKEKKKRLLLLISKTIITFAPLIIGFIYYTLHPLIIPNRLENTYQYRDLMIYSIICYIFTCGIAFYYVLNLSGFLKKNIGVAFLSIFIFIWYLFGIIYFLLDNYGGQSFVFNSNLYNAIAYDHIVEDNINLSDWQKDAVKEIIGTDMLNLETLDLKVNGQKLILSNKKIGRDWASYYYDELEKKYNRYYILSVSPFQLKESDVTDFLPQMNYMDFIKKKYLLVKVRLYQVGTIASPLKQMIQKEDVYEFNDVSNEKIIYLIFDNDNYLNYNISSSNMSVYIFQECLSESNTLLDSTLNTFIVDTNNKSSMRITDYLYYSMTVISTLGFGDITPNNEVVKILTIFESFAGLITMGLFLSKIFDKTK
ncbi:potassium channel family protein [Desulfosporosinus sp. SB140]|uniref:potassium channel family protein n=1 Tax=Desulfosporosinus paludis TaxID=3115649 RepID=UPI00388F4ADF